MHQLIGYSMDICLAACIWLKGSNFENSVQL